MAEVSENQLSILETEVWTLISKNPESYGLQVQATAIKILQSNFSLLQPNLQNELSALSQVAQSQSITEDAVALNRKLWQMIDDVYMHINEQKVATVRAAICATPYLDPQDPQMTLEYLVVFSKAAGFTNESIFQAIASSFSIANEV